MWKCDIWSPARELEEGRARDRVMSPDSNLSPEEKSVGRVDAGVAITGWAAALGARRVLSEEVDRAFGMPIGKLRSRAGIESVSYAVEGETEVSLGAQALQQALGAAACEAKDIDCIIASSETHVAYPSLAAQLHKRENVRESCGVLDAGGACLGLLNALAVAQSFLECGRARSVAVVTADVHSRTLVPGKVAGEFGGLFGDGASAFVLHSAAPRAGTPAYLLREFLFGCAGQYSGAVTVADATDGSLNVHFDGEALSRAAITRMEKVLSAIEKLSAIPRAAVGAFATHQPNPRLLSLLAKITGVSPEAFQPIARTAGNLGSSTCGAALHAALQMFCARPVAARKPI